MFLRLSIMLCAFESQPTGMTMEFSDREKRIIEQLRKSPRLYNCFEEMADLASDCAPFSCGDDAEDAVVDCITKTGGDILRTIVEKKAQEANEKACADPGLRPHKKGI